MEMLLNVFCCVGDFFCNTRYISNISQSIETILPGPVQMWREKFATRESIALEIFCMDEDDDVLEKRSRLPAP